MKEMLIRIIPQHTSSRAVSSCGLPMKRVAVTFRSQCNPFYLALRDRDLKVTATIQKIFYELRIKSWSFVVLKLPFVI